MPIYSYEGHSRLRREALLEYQRRELGTQPTYRRSHKEVLNAIVDKLIPIVVVISIFAVGYLWLQHTVKEAEAAETAAMADATQVWETTKTTNLASMNATATTETSGHGGMLFGSGTFVVRTSKDQLLRYVEKRSDGGYTMGSVSAENAVIYEINDKSNPRVEIQTCAIRTDKPEHQSWIDEHKDRCNDADGMPMSKSKQTRVRVYVPKGTVVDTFNVDSKD